jgi:hypothetical protein
MSAKTCKFGVIGAILIAGAAASLLLVEHRSVVRLSRENQTLQQQAGEWIQLSAENERLSNLVAQTAGPRSLSKAESSELLRLRGEVGRLRRQEKEFSNLREENRRFRAMLATNSAASSVLGSEAGSPDYLPKGSWTFTGYATPEAAFQSGLWAANNGDVKTFLASITGEMEANVRQDLKDKSDSEAAAKAIAEVAKISSCRIFNREYRSADEVVLTISVQEEEKAITSKLLMKRVANDWKLGGKVD